MLYKGKKWKNAYKKRKNGNFEKQKKRIFSSFPKDHSIKKLGSQFKRCVLQPADRQTDRNILVLYKEKNALRITQPKSQVPMSKCVLCSLLTDKHTDKQTHESEYRGHPFRVSGIFPSTYHQGSVQKLLKIFNHRTLNFLICTLFSSKGIRSSLDKYLIPT